jgi:PST family polysaccharide transporter
MIVGELDSLLIGRFYGSGAVGFYSRAQALLRRPLDQFLSPISQVIVPALSRLQTDPERYRRAFFKAYDLTLMGGLIFAGLLCALAHPLALVMLGKEWEETAFIFSALSGIAIYAPLGSVASWLFTSQGRDRDLLKSSSVTGVLTVVSIAAGLPFGPLGVAASITLSGIFIRLPYAYFCAGRSGPISALELWKRFAEHFPVWIAVFFATTSTRMALSEWRPLSQLLVSLPVGLMTAAGVTLFLRRPREAVLTLLRDLLARRRPQEQPVNRMSTSPLSQRN